MPITEQEIIDLSNELLSYQRNVDLAQNQLNQLIKKDTIIFSKGTELKNPNSGIRVSFDFFTYLIYDLNGDLESADRNAYDQWFEDNHYGINPTSIEPNYWLFDELFIHLCQSIDNAIGYLKMRQSQLQEWVDSQP